MVSRDLLEIFPYKNFRPNQQKLIDYIYNIFSQGKLGLAHAPTGLGKTISILSAYLLEPKRKLFVVTRTKSQLRIYAKELEKLRKRVDFTFLFLRSKQDLCPLVLKNDKYRKMPYSVFLKVCDFLKKSGKCPYYRNSVRDGVFTEDLANIAQRILSRGMTRKRLIKAGIKNKLCPYEIARYSTKFADIIIGTYPYLVSKEVREVFLRGADLRLEELNIVFDEAHNLPELAISLNTKTLSLGYLERTISNIKSEDLVDFQDELSEIKEALENLKTIMISELNKLAIKRDALFDFSEIFSEFDERIFIRMRDVASLVIGERPALAVELLRIADFAEYIYRDYSDDRDIGLVELRYLERIDYLFKIVPIDPIYIVKGILERVHAALIISGTLHPLEYYRLVLGLNEEPLYARTEGLVVSDPFGGQNLRIYLDVEVTSKFEARNDAMINEYSRRISTIIKSLWDLGIILVATPSYSLERDILAKLDDELLERSIIETPKTKFSSVMRGIRKGKRIIFGVAGGKLTEGIELRKAGLSLIKAVIIAGLPFPEFNTITRKRVEYYSKKMGNEYLGQYIAVTAPMVRRVMQIGGRIIRSRRDKGIIFILDHRYGRYARYFPKVPWQVYTPYRTVASLKRILNEARQFLS